MSSRTLNRKRPPKRVGATTKQEWRRLCQKAIKAAEVVKDRRLGGLKKALETGREMQSLRAMGIICEADIAREFSKPQT
jgi:hypothetical protein